MAVYLGVSISDLALNPSWINPSTQQCTGYSLTAGSVNYYGLSSVGLIQGIYDVTAAASNYGELGLDVVEENLWGLLVVVESFNAPLGEWFEGWQELWDNTRNLPIDSLTDTPESCGLTRNELLASYNAMDNFLTQLNNAYNALYNTMAAVQAYEQQEIEEEILEGIINEQINDNNQAVLDNAKSAQQLNILNTLYSFQTFILPALIIVVGYMLYKRMRR